MHLASLSKPSSPGKQQQQQQQKITTRVIIGILFALVVIVGFFNFSVDSPAAHPSNHGSSRKGITLYALNDSLLPLPDSYFEDDAYEVFWGDKVGIRTDRDSATNTRLVNFMDTQRKWYTEALSFLGEPAVHLHRRQWEILALFHAARSSVDFSARDNVKMLGFGVGNEVLPAGFVKAGAAKIVATDPASVDDAAASLEGLMRTDLVSKERLTSAVEYRNGVTTTNIPSDLLQGQFDVVWSSSTMEHAGAIDASVDFLLKSALALKPGGIALHTTEIIVSSLRHKLEILNTISLLRVPDIERAAEMLERPPYNAKMTTRDYFAGDHSVDKMCDEHDYHTNKHYKLFRDWDRIGPPRWTLHSGFVPYREPGVLTPLCHTSILIVIQKKK